MSADWPMAQLGDYCNKIGSGATPRGGASVYLDKGEICLIRSQNVYNDGFKPEGLVYITDDSAKKLKNVVVEENDVLLNITGDSVARVCLAKKQYLPARVNQHVAIIRPNPNEFDPRYVRYVLSSDSIQSYLLTIASVGATRNALTKAMIESLEIPKPAIEVQASIADHLEAFENKIELNTQINQTLEQIAQAIFKSWFVDFEPVKAKMAAKAKLSCSPLPLGEGLGVRALAKRKTPKTLLTNARNLRQSATDAEQLLWKLLRGRQVNNAKFRRQHPIGKYILDFYCHDLKLAIELDGSQHSEADYKQKDAQRTSWLNQQGIRVIRFWNNQVLQETEAVMEMIYNTVANPPSPPAPLPEGEGGLGSVSVSEGDNEHPSVTLAAMIAISGKDEAALKQLQAEQPEAYAELAQTAALFPSAMVESELGEIPAGWTTPRIKDVAATIKGKSYKSTELKESNTALVTLKSFNRGGGYRLDGLKEYTGKYKPEQEVFAGDLIIAYTDVTQAADVIGKPAMVISDSRYDHLVISLDVAVIRPVDDNLKYYLYGVAKTEHFQQHTNAHSTGTTVLHLSKNAVPEYRFTKPSDDLIKIYRKHVQPIFSKINENIEQNNTLSTYRDTLLPKLLAGEIDLSQLQAAAEQ